METLVIYDSPYGNIVFDNMEHVKDDLLKIKKEDEVQKILDSGCVFHVKRLAENLYCHEFDEGDGTIYAYYMIYPDDGEAIFLGDSKEIPSEQ